MICDMREAKGAVNQPLQLTRNSTIEQVIGQARKISYYSC